MKRIGFIPFILILIGATVSFRINPLQADDVDLFKIRPNVLIILNKSLSMNRDPAGNPASSPNRKIDIARRVIFDFLDDYKNGTIDSHDKNSLNIELGYMRIWNASSNDDSNPILGNIRIPSSTDIRARPPYSDIWSEVNTNRMSGALSEYDGAGSYRPLAAALREAKTYFTDYVKPFDTEYACRQKFVILITDAADSAACGGNGSDSEIDNPGIWKRQLSTVLRAKELYGAEIKVFVVGLISGTAPESLKRTLNWAAKYGGTDNPFELNSGDPSAYDVTLYADPCSVPASADPGSYPLSGYAFLATGEDSLRTAIKTIAGYIQEQSYSSYSFTAPTNPSVRVVDKDLVYISSFIPNSTPFWMGSIKAYQPNADGTLPLDKDGYPLNASLIWDASEKLKAITPGSRSIYTYVGNALTSFVYGNLTNVDLGVASDSDRQNLVNHIRGAADPYDVDNDGNKTEVRDWKLGDIFHSNAVVVGSPSAFFEDQGFNGTGGFYEAKKNRGKVIIAGANDGMLHAFDATLGDEKWAFIPNSLLKNLKSMVSIHTYYVDSSPKAADVWFYTGGSWDSSTDTTKSASEWKTVLICGLRKGGKTYFALDVTDTSYPQYLWEFPKPSDTGTLGKVGQSWSEPAIGRVKVEVGTELYERWVAFIGGGFNHTNNTGKALFVIDIKTGEIIKEFSGLSDMNFAFAAPPTAVDTNSDGYIDKVYIGDLRGQMWVFDVSFNESTKKSNSLWSGKVLFKAPQTEKYLIFYNQPAVAFDQLGNPWVYFGTGDREDPKDLTNPAERFYAVIDDGSGTYPRQEIDLADVTSTNTFTNDSTKKGWSIKLTKASDRLGKVLARPTVFNRLVYFTTYTYIQTSNPCSALGEARLYIVEYLSGGGALTVDEMSDLGGTPGDRSTKFGVGIPSFPVIRVDATGKASVIIGSTSGQVYSAKAFSPSSNKQFLYWREISE